MAEQEVVVAGTPMRWLEGHSQSGLSVVFVHGIPTSPLLWRHVIGLLPNHRTLAWEMVGYGGSWAAGEGRDISLSAQADYLIAWIEALDVGNVLIVGHDLGGGVAQIAAVRRPGLFNGMVLTNAVCYDSWPIPSVRMMRRISGMVERTPSKLFRGIFSSFLRRGHDDQQVASDAITTHWRFYDHDQGPAAFARQIDSLRTKDTLSISSRLSDLSLPTTVVWGAADRFQKIHFGRRLARDLDARLDALERAKHFVPEDHPDRVAHAVRFVAQQVGS